MTDQINENKYGLPDEVFRNLFPLITSLIVTPISLGDVLALLVSMPPIALGVALALLVPKPPIALGVALALLVSKPGTPSKGCVYNI
jgi:hypothetical protein